MARFLATLMSVAILALATPSAQAATELGIISGSDKGTYYATARPAASASPEVHAIKDMLGGD
jgi:hypothetical protein